MRTIIATIGLILLASCSTSHSDKEPSLQDKTLALKQLTIDWELKATPVFDRIRTSFPDTAISFTKRIFRPSSATFYTDTLNISDCSILDNLSIHSIRLLNSDLEENRSLSKYTLEEWQFKDDKSALAYSDAVRNSPVYLDLIQAPTLFFLKDSCFYVFQSMDDKYVSEIENIAESFNPDSANWLKTY